MRHIRGRRGFTLVELLTVIVILALLAVLLFPVFAQARMSSKGAACLVNMKGIGTAIELYRGDAEGYYPYAADAYRKIRPGTDDEDLAEMVAFPEVMLPYTGSREVHRCPGDFGDFGNPKVPGTLYEFAGDSYHYHDEIPLAGQNESIFALSTSSLIREMYGSDIILLNDHLPFWHGDRSTDFYKFNALYCDGHARSIGQLDYLKGTSTEF